MNSPILLVQTAKEQVQVAVTCDSDGNPISATSQKQTIDDQGKVSNDGGADAPVISKLALANRASAIAKAEADFEAQIVADNYPDGDFVAFVEPAAGS